MKLTPKLNGKGYATSCTISFGSREARDLNFFNEKGELKKIKSVESIDADTLQIKFEKN